jgi:hypothetical protein
MFIHLKQVNQSYVEHFYDGITYCGISLRASFYFFIHSLWPDLYEFDGSATIKELNAILDEKKQKIN